MPISKDEFQRIGDDEPPRPDLSPETTQGSIYRFLLSNADRAFRQREIVNAVDVPEGSVGPTLKRLEDHGLVAHRDRFWAIADSEHAVAAAGHQSAQTADSVDGGFDDGAVATWMETAVDPIDDSQCDANTSEEQPMPERGTVVWAPDPFKTDGGNPRPWLVVSDERMPYPEKESIVVAFTTQSHHPGSIAVPSEVWIRGEPGQQSYVLPWTVATLKDSLHVVGTQGSVTDEFTDRVTTATISYFDNS